MLQLGIISKEWSKTSFLHWSFEAMKKKQGSSTKTFVFIKNDFPTNFFNWKIFFSLSLGWHSIKFHIKKRFRGISLRYQREWTRRLKLIIKILKLSSDWVTGMLSQNVSAHRVVGIFKFFQLTETFLWESYVTVCFIEFYIKKNSLVKETRWNSQNLYANLHKKHYTKRFARTGKKFKQFRSRQLYTKCN